MTWGAGLSIIFLSRAVVVLTVIWHSAVFPRVRMKEARMEQKTQSWIILLVLFVAEGVELNSIQPTSSYLIPCEQGWFLFGDKCYKVFEISRRVTWFQAKDICADHNGSLVTIQSKELQGFLTLFFLLDLKSDVWIGLNYRKEEREHVWVDGSIVNYAFWDDKELHAVITWPSPAKDCVAMRYTTKGGRWNRFDCDTKLQFMCQTSKSEQNMSHDPRFCSGENDGAWKYQNSCYHTVREEMSWDDAESYCQTVFNGHLLAIIDIGEQQFIKQVVVSDFNRDIWIGIKIHDATEQMWSSAWIVNYNHWEFGHTPNIGTCAYMTTFRFWYSTSCFEKLPFICEAPHVKEPPLKQAPEGWACPELSQDWVDLGGENCYIFETQRIKRWHEANFDCMKIGGHLAIIRSVAEENAIHHRVKGGKETLLIGLHRSITNNSVFEWADGTQLNYQNWKFGEPSHVDKECGEIRTDDMKWSNIHCDYKKGYICSAKKVPIFRQESDGSASIDSQEERKTNSSIAPFRNVSTSIDSHFPVENSSSACASWNITLAVLFVAVSILAVVRFIIYIYKSRGIKNNTFSFLRTKLEAK